MELDRDDDRALYDELLDLIRGKTGGGFRIAEDGSCVEPLIGRALRRFLVHVQEVIVAGGTELIVVPDGTRSGPPDE